MPFPPRYAALLLVILGCASCTAAKVLTHSTSPNPLDAPSGLYHLDPYHWSVTFDVDHLGYSHFVMRFDQMDADLDFQASDPARSSVTARIAAASLDTHVGELDELIRGPDLLDTDQFPEIHFVSRQLHQTGYNNGEMEGDLTIGGVTRPVTLAITFNGGAPNPLSDKFTLGFTAIGHFDRTTFGLSKWYPAVGREIRVTIEAEFNMSR